MNTASIGQSQGLNILQSAQDKVKTQYAVDNLNATLNQGKADNKEVQKDEFLNLLVTQLTYQNPLEPMNDREFIAQMAQLTGVEKLDHMSESMKELSNQVQTNNMVSWLGKKVSFRGAGDSVQTGVVNSIMVDQGILRMQVDGKEVSTENLIQIENNSVVAKNK